MTYEYKKIENMQNLPDGQYWWCYDPTKNDETEMICNIKQPTAHTNEGFWAGPIPTPEQLTEAEKFAHAFMHVQTNLVSIQALSQALADEVLILQEVIKAKNVEVYKDFEDYTEDLNTLGATTQRISCEKPNKSAIAKGSLLCGKCGNEIKMNEPSLEVAEGNQTVLWCMKCVEETGTTVLVEPETTV